MLNVNFYILIFYFLFSHFIFFNIFFCEIFSIFFFFWALSALCSHLGISGPRFEKPLVQTTHRLLCSENVFSDIPAFLYASSFKPDRKQAGLHAQISAYITVCVFVYVSVCPALWMEPLSCHLLLSCSWGGASESKQTANWGCQRFDRARGHTSVPGSTQRPVYSPYTSFIVSLSLFFSPLLSSIHQQSCTPISHHHMETNAQTHRCKHSPFIPSCTLSLAFHYTSQTKPLSTTNINRQWGKLVAPAFLLNLKTKLVYSNHSQSLTWFEHSNLKCLVLSLILIDW